MTPIAILLSALLLAQGKAPPPAMSKANVRQILVEFLSSPDAKKREAARAKLCALREEDKKFLLAGFAEGSFFPPKAPKGKIETGRRKVVEHVDLEGADSPQGEFIIHVPKKYDGQKPFPAIFHFHGTGDNGADYSSDWPSRPFADEFLSVTPTIPSKDKQTWKDPGARALTNAAYRHLLQNYNVDTDRVYFTGFSAGGAAAFYYAQSWPQRVAAFLARGRLWWNDDNRREECMAVIEKIPAFFLIGLKDEEDRVEGYRVAEKYYLAHKMTAVFHFVERRGHEYMAEFDKEGFGFLLQQKRGRPPKSFQAYFFTPSKTPKDAAFLRRQQWLEAESFPAAGLAVRVSIEGNVVAIDGPGLDAGSIYLNEELVDFSKPVAVVLNKNEVFRGVVERSVDFLLRDFEENRDPKQLFWNKVSFKK